ncbi:MAG: hypothetical protein AB7P34_15965 [Vicinamibacterales bacterium]|jgi:hypothetical protein
MFHRHLTRTFLALAVCAPLVAVSGCNSVDLKTAVEVTDVSSGYHDAGVTDLGDNKLVPSFTFRLKNVSTDALSSVEVITYFWGEKDGRPLELDEIIITGISSDGLAPGASTEPLVVRSKQGFTLQQQARSELFNHSMFRDVTVKLLLKRGGRLVPAGEFTIERRLLLAAPSGTSAQ